MNKHDIN